MAKLYIQNGEQKQMARDGKLLLVAACFASVLLLPSYLYGEARQLLWYPFDDSYDSTVVADASGNDQVGLIYGGVVLDSGAAYLDGNDAYIKLPDNILSGLDAITIAATVIVERSQSSPYFVYGLGNTSDDIGSGYLFTTGNHYRTSISDCHWVCEQNTETDGRNLGRGKKHHLVYSLEKGIGTLYLDGNMVAQNRNISLKPGDIGNGFTTANYLGRSLYSSDSYFKGYFVDFQVWDGALSPEAIKKLAAKQLVEPVLTDSEAVKEDWESLVVEHVDDARGHLFLPSRGKKGTQISWSSSMPHIIASDGIVKRASPCTELNSLAWDPLHWYQSALLVLKETFSGCGMTHHVVLTAAIKRGYNIRFKSFQAMVPPLSEPEEFAGYLFTYFTGEGYNNGEQVYLALSRGNNPLDWQEINQEQPVLTSVFGEMGARDPFIIRSPEGDKFYLIATDLKIYGNWDWGRAQTWGSQSILVWESIDLINWTDARLVEVSPDLAGNTWAPEAFWDPDRQHYVVFWASKMYDDPGHSNDTYHRMMYSLTRDFVNFTEPQVWVDVGYSTIDSTLIEDQGMYYRFTKDERSHSNSPCGKFILLETSNFLANTNWDFHGECIGRGTIDRGEGPLVFKSNKEEKWYLFIDEFGGRGYVPFETNSLASGQWTPVMDYHLPASPRHGTVLPITQAEYNAIAQHWKL